jgi:hypothetical protein
MQDMAKSRDSGGEMDGKSENGSREPITPSQTKAAERAARLALELRRNLLKRKQQTRAREDAEDGDGEASC